MIVAQVIAVGHRAPTTKPVIMSSLTAVAYIELVTVGMHTLARPSPRLTLALR